MKKLLLVSLILLQPTYSFAEPSKETMSKDMQHAEKHMKGVPESIKKYFKGGEVSLEHRVLSKDQIKEIEKDSGSKPDDYFHTFVAVGLKNGKKAQLGASTIVKPKGTDIEFALVYDSHLEIKDVIGIKNTDKIKNLLPELKGKGHHDSFIIGKDIKKSDKDVKLDEKVLKSVRLDVFIMQALWGKPHKH